MEKHLTEALSDYNQIRLNKSISKYFSFESKGPLALEYG
jgi:hypothetical protein